MLVRDCNWHEALLCKNVLFLEPNRKITSTEQLRQPPLPLALLILWTSLSGSFSPTIPNRDCQIRQQQKWCSFCYIARQWESDDWYFRRLKRLKHLIFCQNDLDKDPNSLGCQSVTLGPQFSDLLTHVQILRCSKNTLATLSAKGAAQHCLMSFQNSYLLFRRVRGEIGDPAFQFQYLAWASFIAGWLKC